EDRAIGRLAMGRIDDVLRRHAVRIGERRERDRVRPIAVLAVEDLLPLASSGQVEAVLSAPCPHLLGREMDDGLASVGASRLRRIRPEALRVAVEATASLALRDIEHHVACAHSMPVESVERNDRRKRIRRAHDGARARARAFRRLLIPGRDTDLLAIADRERGVEKVDRDDVDLPALLAAIDAHDLESFRLDLAESAFVGREHGERAIVEALRDDYRDSVQNHTARDAY